MHSQTTCVACFACAVFLVFLFACAVFASLCPDIIGCVDGVHVSPIGCAVMTPPQPATHNPYPPVTTTHQSLWHSLRFVTSLTKLRSRPGLAA